MNGACPDDRAISMNIVATIKQACTNAGHRQYKLFHENVHWVGVYCSATASNKIARLMPETGV